MPSSREALSRERLLTGAMAFADEHGLARLSMRRLARDLGFEAMALYNHVANKADLLAGIVDRVAAEVEPPRPGRPWREELQRAATATHEALLRHPWAVDQWMSTLPGPSRLALMEGMLATLAALDLPADLFEQAFHAIDNHVLGFTIQRLNLLAMAEDVGDGGAGFLAQLDRDRHPHLAAHIEGHLAGTVPMDGFAFGIELVLDRVATGVRGARGSDGGE